MTDAPMRLRSTRQIAEWLGFDQDTLEAMRRRGEGPPFIRLGDGKRPAIRYNLDDVEAWLRSHTVGKAVRS